jgi:hypothetical protein
MAGDELVRRAAIAVLAPALGLACILPGAPTSGTPDFLKIMGEAGFGRKGRQGRVGAMIKPSN